MPCWVWWVCGVQPVLSYSSYIIPISSIIEQFYCVATDLCELVFTTFSFKSNGRCQRSVKRSPRTVTETAFSGKKLPLHLNLSTHPTKSLLWNCETREWSGFEQISLFVDDILVELTNTVSDGKIQITILILRRGVLSSFEDQVV